MASAHRAPLRAAGRACFRRPSASHGGGSSGVPQSRGLRSRRGAARRARCLRLRLTAACSAAWQAGAAGGDLDIYCNAVSSAGYYLLPSPEYGADFSSNSIGVNTDLLFIPPQDPDDFAAGG